MSQLAGLLASLLALILHAALVALAAPWLIGFDRKLRAKLQGRQGAPIMQSWRDLIRLWRKESVWAENASTVSQAAPLVAFAASASAALLVPSFSLGLSTAAAADLLLIAGLFALARAAMAMAALDAGTWRGGLAVSRGSLAALFAEPALLLVFFALSLLAGSTNLDRIADLLRTGSLGPRVSLGLALAATVTIALTSLGRLPAGDPICRQEPAMRHEAAGLEFSGRDLALIEYAAQLRFFTWLALLVAIFAPFGAAAAASLFDWPRGLLLFAAKMLLLVALLAAFEAGTARMRLFRLPELLGFALMLALLAVWFLLVSQGGA